MSNDDDALRDRVVDRLHAIRTRLGSRVFRTAAHKAMVGIGRAALAEGERRATPSETRNGPGNVVRSAETPENRRDQEK
jgi:hypothetical protein